MGNLRRVKKGLMQAKGIDTQRTVEHKNKSGKVTYYDVSTVCEHKIVTVNNPEHLKAESK